MNNGREAWSGGTLSEKSAALHRGMTPTLRNIVRPSDVIQKCLPKPEETIEKSLEAEGDQPGLGSAMGLKRFVSRPSNPLSSPSAVSKTAKVAVAEGLTMDVEKVLKETGFDKLPLSDHGKQVLEEVLRKGKPATEYTGKIMVDHGVAEMAPAFVRPGALKNGDRVIPLQWTPMGVFGAQFDIPFLPEVGRVRGITMGPAKVTKKSYPPGQYPADLSKEETVTENRMWSMTLERDKDAEKDGVAGMQLSPVSTRETTMVLRLEPLASPAGETRPK